MKWQLSILLVVYAQIVIAVPATLNVHGSTSNSAGLLNGTFNVSFAVYNSSGASTPFYNQTSLVTFVNGFYSSNLNFINPLYFLQNNVTFIGLSVNKDAEATPRINITSVPYAMVSEWVTNERGQASCPGSAISSYNETTGNWTCATLTGSSTTNTTIWGNVIINGNLSVENLSAKNGMFTNGLNVLGNVSATSNVFVGGNITMGGIGGNAAVSCIKLGFDRDAICNDGTSSLALIQVSTAVNRGIGFSGSGISLPTLAFPSYHAKIDANGTLIIGNVPNTYYSAGHRYDLETYRSANITGNVSAESLQLLNITGSGSAGKVTLASGTAKVFNTRVNANSLIFLTNEGGKITNIGTVYMGGINANSFFYINSSNVLDTSTVAYMIVDLNK